MEISVFQIKISLFIENTNITNLIEISVFEMQISLFRNLIIFYIQKIINTPLLKVFDMLVCPKQHESRALQCGSGIPLYLFLAHLSTKCSR